MGIAKLLIVLAFMAIVAGVGLSLLGVDVAPDVGMPSVGAGLGIGAILFILLVVVGLLGVGNLLTFGSFMGFYLIKDNDVGIVRRNMFGTPLEPGQVIARDDQIGIQADVLYPGIKFKMPYVFTVFRRGLTQIPENKVGLVTAIDGAKFDPGRAYGKAVACDDFQDAKAFFANGGQQGPQMAILTPRSYRINTEVFTIEIVDAVNIDDGKIGLVNANDGLELRPGQIYGDQVECDNFQDPAEFFANGGQQGPQKAILRPRKYYINRKLFIVDIVEAVIVPEGKIGVVIANDGQRLPTGFVIAPLPKSGKGKKVVDGIETEFQYPNHSSFQNAQAFVEAEGYRGPQEDVLQPSVYYINRWMFKVELYDYAEVPPGFVAVLRSNVGEELAHATIHGEVKEGEGEDVHEIAEGVLSNDKRQRGILKKPVGPGKYPMNPLAYTAFLVPTSAITIDWASEHREGRQINLDVSGKERLTINGKTSSANAEEFFRFSQLKVTSFDGFQLEVDAKVIVRIEAQWAAYVIARFGSVKNMIEQIIHPLIDSSFRNKAGDEKGIVFIQSRNKLQQEALDKARTEFEKYHIETQNLLIAYIDAPDDLLATQTKKQIAELQIAQFAQEALAAEKSIEVEKQKALALQQPKLQAAVVGVQIAERNAKAAEVQGLGIGRRNQSILQGTANGIQHIADAVGADNAAAMQIMDRVRDGGIKITPDTLVMSGEGADANSSILGAFFARTLGEGRMPFERKAVPEVPEIVVASEASSKKKEVSASAAANKSGEDQMLGNINRFAESLVPGGLLGDVAKEDQASGSDGLMGTDDLLKMAGVSEVPVEKEKKGGEDAEVKELMKDTRDVGY